MPESLVRAPVEIPGDSPRPGSERGARTVLSRKQAEACLPLHARRLRIEISRCALVSTGIELESEQSFRGAIVNFLRPQLIRALADSFASLQSTHPDCVRKAHALYFGEWGVARVQSSLELFGEAFDTRLRSLSCQQKVMSWTVL